MLLAGLNLVSIICYSYPVTTTLRFNLGIAARVFLGSIILIWTKLSPRSVLLPANRPWYLVPFLRVVELVRLLVRPVTLCFRLLANLRAGHILLALISKLSQGAWLLGRIFGVLELIVSLVQAFVFFMLCRVYLEEAVRH